MGPPSSVVSSTVRVSTSVAALVRATAVAATTAPPVTTTLAAVPTTAPTATTTISPIDRAAAEVRAASIASKDSNDVCFANPMNCDRAAFTRRFSPDLAAKELARLDEAVRNGVLSRPNADPNLSYVVIEGVVVAASLDAAEVTTCHVNGGVQYTVSKVPGQTEVVVDDQVLGYSRRLGFKKIDGVWKIFTAVLFDRFDPLVLNMCPARTS